MELAVVFRKIGGDLLLMKVSGRWAISRYPLMGL